jgi:flagellin
MASFSVISNIASANAQANLATNSVGLNKTLNRLSSGFRINYSGDDAAGLAVANSYRSTVAVLNQGVRNANDGLSSLQIKDGALNNISTLLDRLSTLSTQAASGGFKGDRATLAAEATSILDEIDREAKVAGLDTAVAGYSVYVGGGDPTAAADNKVSGDIAAANVAGLGLAAADFAYGTGVAATDIGVAETAIEKVADAVKTLGEVQGQVGTLENAFQFAVSLAQSQIVNTRAAESRIRDANIAEESANMTRHSILNQSGIAALSQANQQASAVLSLLR